MVIHVRRVDFLIMQALTCEVQIKSNAYLHLTLLFEHHETIE